MSAVGEIRLRDDEVLVKLREGAVFGADEIPQGATPNEEKGKEEGLLVEEKPYVPLVKFNYHGSNVHWTGKRRI